MKLLSELRLIYPVILSRNKILSIFCTSILWIPGKINKTRVVFRKSENTVDEIFALSPIPIPKEALEHFPDNSKDSL